MQPHTTGAAVVDCCPCSWDRKKKKEIQTGHDTRQKELLRTLLKEDRSKGGGRWRRRRCSEGAEEENRLFERHNLIQFSTQ